MCHNCKFMCKTVQKMYDPSNPNNFINCRTIFMYTMISIPLIIIWYFLGVYTFYGLGLLINPEHTQSVCFNNNIMTYVCYLGGIWGMIAILLILAFVGAIIILICLCLASIIAYIIDNIRDFITGYQIAANLVASDNELVDSTNDDHLLTPDIIQESDDE